MRVHLRDRAVVLPDAVVWDVDRGTLRVYDGVDRATRKVLLMAVAGGWTAIEPHWKPRDPDAAAWPEHSEWCGHSAAQCAEVAPSGGRCCVACVGHSQ